MLPARRKGLPLFCIGSAPTCPTGLPLCVAALSLMQLPHVLFLSRTPVGCVCLPSPPWCVGMPTRSRYATHLHLVPFAGYGRGCANGGEGLRGKFAWYNNTGGLISPTVTVIAFPPLRRSSPHLCPPPMRLNGLPDPSQCLAWIV